MGVGAGAGVGASGTKMGSSDFWVFFPFPAGNFTVFTTVTSSEAAKFLEFRSGFEFREF